MAKEIGALAIPASGATPWAKEDMKTELYLIQHKQVVSAKSHSIKIADLEELRRNAIDADLEPCYVIEYGNRRWFMVGEETWEYLNESG